MFIPEESKTLANISGFEADFLADNPLSAAAYQTLTTTTESGYTHEQMERTLKPTQVLEFHMGLRDQKASSLLVAQSRSTGSGNSSSVPPLPAGRRLAAGERALALRRSRRLRRSPHARAARPSHRRLGAVPHQGMEQRARIQ